MKYPCLCDWAGPHIKQLKLTLHSLLSRILCQETGQSLVPEVNEIFCLIGFQLLFIQLSPGPCSVKVTYKELLRS